MMVSVTIEELTEKLMSTAYIWHKVSPNGQWCSTNAAMTRGIHKTPKERKGF